MSGSRSFESQIAALPVRGKGNTREVLLITSRETRRWIIPKGWPMKGLKDHEAAAQEAFEEAGVRGHVHKHPLGAYTYEKKTDGVVKPIRVMVYLLEVDREDESWREKDQRDRRWVAPHEAVGLLSDPSLAGIINRLDDYAKD